MSGPRMVPCPNVHCRREGNHRYIRASRHGVLAHTPLPRRLELPLHRETFCMHVGVYGSGYLGTVISACLADFGTPVSCCHPDRTSMVEMAQGNIPFFEKNLKEIIRRNVRAGRLAYSTDIESFARKTGVIFLAEDKAENLNDIAIRITRLAPKPPVLTIVTPAPVGTANALEKNIKDIRLQATIV